MSIGRIFLLESPNALDLLEGTGETTSLSQVCKLFGHDIASFHIRDRDELRQTLLYVSSVGWREDSSEIPIFIHLSAHANTHGLAIGRDEVTWQDLAALVVEMFREIYKKPGSYEGPIVVVVSACHTNGKALSRHLRDANRRNKLKWPPEYVFVFDDPRVDWRDAVVTWTMFYHDAPRMDFSDASGKGPVQKLLRRVNRSKYGKLRYFRWECEGEKYKTYPTRG